MKRSALPVAFIASAVLFPTGGQGLTQEAPAQLQLTRKDAQNFLASAPGELRIVGDPDRYDILLPADVLFDFDRSDLRPDAEPLLQKVGAHLAAHKADQIHVRGHTDSKGTDQHNFTLSQKRAGSVCAWLKREVEGVFTNCIGRGEEDPLLPNQNADGSDNPEHRQLNRRVTISVVAYPDAKGMLDAARGQAQDALETLKKPTPR